MASWAPETAGPPLGPTRVPSTGKLVNSCEDDRLVVVAEDDAAPVAG